MKYIPMSSYHVQDVVKSIVTDDVTGKIIKSFMEQFQYPSDFLYLSITKYCLGYIDVRSADCPVDYKEIDLFLNPLRKARRLISLNDIRVADEIDMMLSNIIMHRDDPLKFNPTYYHMLELFLKDLASNGTGPTFTTDEVYDEVSYNLERIISRLETSILNIKKKEVEGKIIIIAPERLPGILNIFLN